MVQGLRLQNFRSYVDDSFEFSPNVNIIIGPNASGKTNLLEAILVMARGSSYRARDADLVAFERPWARLDAYLDDSTRTVKIVLDPLAERLYEIDGRTIKRLRLDDSLPVVLFEPNHLLLLTGSPDKRREYLDDLLAQITPGYSTIVRSYRRVLAQRNRLLKSSRPSLEYLFPWNVRLSELGAQIVRARTKLVEIFKSRIDHLYQDISASTTKVAMSYSASESFDQYESQMLRRLEQRVNDDIARGFTSVGPHREDVIVTFNGYAAENVASRGETRTLVLCLKVIELQLLQEVRKETPLLLLDDVFSELDGTRRKALTDYLQPYQTFITTTDADIVMHHFAERSNVIMLSNEDN